VLKKTNRSLVLTSLFAVMLLLGTACSSSSTPAPKSTSSAAKGGKIALLLPESKTARYETQDRPIFEARVKAICSDCEILYSNADQDVTKQQSQAEAALTNGAKVLVLDPVDAKASASIATMAKSKGVPVISYDRLVLGAPVDYYVSFDNEKVGHLQGQALVQKLKADGKGTGTIVMINGAPVDNNATLFKKGAHSEIDGSGLAVGAEYDTPDWSPDKAQQEMEQAITRLGKAKIVGVYAANDGTAGGAIAAMKAAGFSPIPPITGQDAELAGIQRIIAGDQYMTIYKAIKPQAQKSAELAVALARGQKAPTGLVNGKTNNGVSDVPSVVLAPVAVTASNVKSTVVADGFWTVPQICTTAYAAACSKAGLS
jgi:D-xylose transport system substrate-binding protein